jgi:hypothetical protein
MSEELVIKHLPLGMEHILTIPALIQSSKLSRDSIVNAIFSIIAKPPFREVVVEVIKSIIAHELTHLVNARYSISVVEDAEWGFVYIITLEVSARKALEVNLELQRRFPGIPIVVKWVGSMDLSEEELVDYVVRITRAGGFKARAPQGFSSVEAVREVREE